MLRQFEMRHRHAISKYRRAGAVDPLPRPWTIPSATSATARTAAARFWPSCSDDDSKVM
jgi:hypothetical protein